MFTILTNNILLDTTYDPNKAEMLFNGYIEDSRNGYGLVAGEDIFLQYKSKVIKAFESGRILMEVD